jgi:small subunit ribosomal protein S21|tara:strand:+ start:329 stop:553 length:225 start_codon:yes stop_codon:yes gene_type:complete
MPTNVVIKQRRNESPEKMIRRFMRKCKKERVVEIYKEKTDFYSKPSVKKKVKKKKARREQQKLQRKLDAKLFRP